MAFFETRAFYDSNHITLQFCTPRVSVKTCSQKTNAPLEWMHAVNWENFKKYFIFLATFQSILAKYLCEDCKDIKGDDIHNASREKHRSFTKCDFTSYSTTVLIFCKQSPFVITLLPLSQKLISNQLLVFSPSPLPLHIYNHHQGHCYWEQHIAGNCTQSSMGH